jgi:aminoglycoside phosphotransferase
METLRPSSDSRNSRDYLSGLRGEVARLATEAGFRVVSVSDLRGGHGEGGFVLETRSGRLAAKARTDARPLAFANHGTRLAILRGCQAPGVVIAPTLIRDRWVMVSEWWDGEALQDVPFQQWTRADQSALGADLARWTAKLHGKAGVRTGEWRRRAERRLDAKLNALVKSDILSSASEKGVRDYWFSLCDAVEKAPLSVIHRDLQPGNILVQGRVFAAVIDFEQCRVADPLYDLVKLRQYIFNAAPIAGQAFESEYPLDFGSPEVQMRLEAVEILEALSAMVYFQRRRQLGQVFSSFAGLKRLVGIP